MNSSMKNRICLITGGTSGVGRATASGLARLGATVILVSRNESKGASVVREIINQSGNTRVEMLIADLSEPGSVAELARNFQSRYGSLHVLSNNAAVLPMKRKTNSLGHEIIFATNYLGHFLLNNLLLDMLKKSAPSRILTVAGNIGILRLGKIHFDDVQLEHSFSPLKATVQAAYAKVLFSLDLARKLEGSGVTSNAFHPGLVRSRLGRDLPVFMKPFFNAANAFMPRECKTSVFLASDDTIEKMTGVFYENGKAHIFTSRNCTDENIGKLWDMSEKLCFLSKTPAAAFISPSPPLLP